MFDVSMIFSLMILIAVAFVALRTGRANPVDTGSLQQDVTVLKRDVAAIRRDLDAQPSAADVAALRAEITGMRREMELVIKSSDRTEQAVVRIEGLLMERSK